MTQLKGGPFKVGDTVTIERWRGGGKPAQIIGFRHQIGNRNTGSLSASADVMLEDGNTRCCFLHDLARDNPDHLARTFARDTAARTMLAALKLVEDYSDVMGGKDGAAIEAAIAAAEAAGIKAS